MSKRFMIALGAFMFSLFSQTVGGQEQYGKPDNDSMRPETDLKMVFEFDAPMMKYFKQVCLRYRGQRIIVPSEAVNVTIYRAGDRHCIAYANRSGELKCILI